MPDLHYVPGRVIRDDASVFTDTPCLLLYFFRGLLDEMAIPPRAALQTSELLVPPVLTNRLPWSRGYFETLGNLAFDTGEILPTHSFRSHTRRDPTYFDEQRRRVEPVEPIGDWGLHSFRTIDDLLSRALDLPLAPDDT